MVDLYNGILYSSNKEKLLPFMRKWMDLNTITLNEISQSVKRHIPYDVTYKWNLMNKVN